LHKNDFHQIIGTFILSVSMNARPKRSYDITALQRGLRLLHLFSESLNQLDIRRLSLPYLRELNQQTRETIHLTVRHGLSAVYVEKLDSPEPLCIHSRIGAAVPLNCTAVGKVMLAYMPKDERDLVLPKLDLKCLTPNSVGNVQELKTELYRVRKNGYACDMEEHELHIRCVAAPIWDHTGSVQSSLSITAPTLRMPVMRLRRLAPIIQAAGLKISAELGYQSQSPSSWPALNRNGKTEARLRKMAV
jgi:DNA-binding IclR family transcriptional regulator